MLVNADNLHKIDYERSKWILSKYFNIKIELHESLPSVEVKDPRGSLGSKEFTQQIGRDVQTLALSILEIISKPMEYLAC